ncbi:MAG TPA: type I restriction endonuclease, partial [Candidatus Kapabacteria bacterium]|nr:type I restriction endonuclease [Candidatus Kapabacteria bacterium]
MKFTEEQLEKAYIELMEQQGYRHYLGENIARHHEDVIIEEDIRHFLARHYASQNITEKEISTIILQLRTLSSMDLYTSNMTFMRMIADGFILQREDRTQKDIHIELLDYAGLEHHRYIADTVPIRIAAEPQSGYSAPQNDKNIYKFVTQLEIEGDNKRIPDGIVYINGLPLLVFEFKSVIRENTDIFEAYTQLTTRYRRDIPSLFIYNCFCIISDGINTKAGSFFAPYEYYYAWRRIAVSEKTQPLTETDIVDLSKFSREDAQGIQSMFTLVQGMLHKDRLRDIIRNFIFMPDTGNKEQKIVCRYPQYYAARALYTSITKARKPRGNGKGGTYFGATGCGKSYTMLFLTRLLMRSEHFASPTIVLITDRTDLDAQLSEQFVEAKQYIGDH